MMPLVNAIDKRTSALVDAIDKRTFIIETLVDKVGRGTAKWLELANLPNIRNELREDAYSLLGFLPAQIVDLLYPAMGKLERKTKRQAISKRNKKALKSY